MNGLFFSAEELRRVDDVQKLYNILEYFGVDYNPKLSRAKLIQIILDKQKEFQPHLTELVPEEPRYSVRLQRIMDSQKENDNEQR